MPRTSSISRGLICRTRQDVAAHTQPRRNLGEGVSMRAPSRPIQPYPEPRICLRPAPSAPLETASATWWEALMPAC